MLEASCAVVRSGHGFNKKGLRLPSDGWGWCPRQTGYSSRITWQRKTDRPTAVRHGSTVMRDPGCRTIVYSGRGRSIDGLSRHLSWATAA
jgi:hypothetical protein